MYQKAHLKSDLAYDPGGTLAALRLRPGASWGEGFTVRHRRNEEVGLYPSAVPAGFEDLRGIICKTQAAGTWGLPRHSVKGAPCGSQLAVLAGFTVCCLNLKVQNWSLQEMVSPQNSYLCEPACLCSGCCQS